MRNKRTAPRRAGPKALLVVAVLASAFALLAPGAAVQAQRATRTSGPDQLVPLYDDTSASDWAAVCSQTNAAGEGSFVIADVDAGAGPGTAPVPAYSTVIDNCDSWGRAQVIGYVWTGYGEGGTASIPAIEAEVSDWYAFYPGHIGGIFFDGAADTVPGTGASNVSFYQALASYVHKNWGNSEEVVLNYGANPGSGWMFNSSNAKNANMVVVFEGSYDTTGENPFYGWAQASWELQYPASDFAALMYDTNSTATVAQPATACAALEADHLGYLYVGQWYTQLASYWPQFVADCSGGPREAISGLLRGH